MGDIYNYNFNKNTNENHTHVKRGVGFIGLLALLFIALKLANVITWSWLWVLSPVWISAFLVIAAVILLFVVVKNI